MQLQINFESSHTKITGHRLTVIVFQASRRVVTYRITGHRLTIIVYFAKQRKNFMHLQIGLSDVSNGLSDVSNRKNFLSS